MNIGKYVFAQVIEFIPRHQFDKLVGKYNGDWHAKSLNCYNQFLHLLFGQFTACDSIRDICLCLEAHSGSIYHLGIRNTVINLTCVERTRRETTTSMKSWACISFL